MGLVRDVLLTNYLSMFVVFVEFDVFIMYDLFASSTQV